MLKVYLLENRNNIRLLEYLKRKYKLASNINECDVLIIHKVYDVKKALDIVDYALMLGKEIICIKGEFKKEHYVTNFLIQNGAIYI